MAWKGWENYNPAGFVVESSRLTPKVPKRRDRSLEDALVEQCRLIGLPAPEREARLIPGRKFQWDLVWRIRRLAVEVQGGTWTQGAHSRGAGQARDAKKQALATLEGWRCLAVTADQIRSGEAVTWIEQALKGQAA